MELGTGLSMFSADADGDISIIARFPKILYTIAEIPEVQPTLVFLTPTALEDIYFKHIALRPLKRVKYPMYFQHL